MNPSDTNTIPLPCGHAHTVHQLFGSDSDQSQPYGDESGVDGEGLGQPSDADDLYMNMQEASGLDTSLNTGLGSTTGPPTGAEYFLCHYDLQVCCGS